MKLDSMTDKDWFIYGLLTANAKGIWDGHGGTTLHMVNKRTGLQTQQSGIIKRVGTQLDLSYVPPREMTYSSDDNQLMQYLNHVLTLPTAYVWGADGQLMSEKLLKDLKADLGPSNYPMPDSYYMSKFGYDCSGLLTNISGKNMTADSYYVKATQEGAAHGPISTMPEDYCLVFCLNSTGTKMRHVGVYIKQGRTIDTRTRANDINNAVAISQLSTESWTHWAQPKWLLDLI